MLAIHHQIPLYVFQQSIACDIRRTNRLDALLLLKIARHQILEHQNDVPEEGIRQAAGERLLCPVEHEYKVGKLRELGVAAPGKGYDLMSVLLCVAHVVEDRLRLAALADGEHDLEIGYLFTIWVRCVGKC